LNTRGECDVVQRILKEDRKVKEQEATMRSVRMISGQLWRNLMSHSANRSYKIQKMTARLEASKATAVVFQ